MSEQIWNGLKYFVNLRRKNTTTSSRALHTRHNDEVIIQKIKKLRI